MKRVLKIEVVSKTDDLVTFKIVEQSHRGMEFGGFEQWNFFTASNGFTLLSCASGPRNWFNNTLRVRGVLGYEAEDENYIATNPETFKMIEEAIAEYNKQDC